MLPVVCQGLYRVGGPMMRSFIFGILGILLIALGFYIGRHLRNAIESHTPTPIHHRQSNLSYSPQPSQSSQPPTPTATPYPHKWYWHRIERYVDIAVPQGWRIIDYTFVTDSGLLCPATQLISPDNTAHLFVEVECGFAEGIGESCPAGIVDIYELGGTHIYRFTTNGTQFYYTTGGFARVEDKTGSHPKLLCISPPSITLPNHYGPFSITHFRARFFSPESLRYLRVMDQIVIRSFDRPGSE